jgi:hypothetical protein
MEEEEAVGRGARTRLTAAQAQAQAAHDHHERQQAHRDIAVLQVGNRGQREAGGRQW